MFWPHHATCEILVPSKGSNLCPLHWKHEILTTGQPGKSKNCCFEMNKMLAFSHCVFFFFFWYCSQIKNPKTNLFIHHIFIKLLFYAGLIELHQHYYNYQCNWLFIYIYSDYYKYWKPLRVLVFLCHKLTLLVSVSVFFLKPVCAVCCA